MRLALVPVNSEDLNKPCVLIKHERQCPRDQAFFLWSLEQAPPVYRVGSVPCLWVEVSIMPLPPLPAGEQGPPAASAAQLAKAAMSLSTLLLPWLSWARALSQLRAHNVRADVQRQALEGRWETAWKAEKGTVCHGAETGGCGTWRGQECREKQVPGSHGHSCANCGGAGRAEQAGVGGGAAHGGRVLVTVGEKTHSPTESLHITSHQTHQDKQHPRDFPYREQRKGKCKSNP